jgi:TetR/AcrR family transcriptional regulator
VSEDADGSRDASGASRYRLPSADEQRGLREEVILECAAVWFHRHGFHGTSLADIAGELGVTKAALYHYTKNKEDLIYRLHLRSLIAAKDARDRAMEEGGSGLDRLCRLVHNFVLVMTGSPARSFIRIEPGTLGPGRDREVRAARRWLEHDLRDLVQRGVDDGSIAPCDPKLVAVIVIGAQNWIGTWYRSDEAWAGQEVASGYAQMMRRMLASTRTALVEPG